MHGEQHGEYKLISDINLWWSLWKASLSNHWWFPVLNPEVNIHDVALRDGWPFLLKHWWMYLVILETGPSLQTELKKMNSLGLQINKILGNIFDKYRGLLLRYDLTTQLSFVSHLSKSWISPRLSWCSRPCWSHFSFHHSWRKGWCYLSDKPKGEW